MKNLFLLLFLGSFVCNGQTQYYLYKASDSTFVKSNYYEIAPEYSTTTAPAVDVSYAKWNGTTWIDFRTPDQIIKLQVPFSVTRRQLKLQLTLSGFNLSLIDYVIGQLPEPDRSFALIGWNDSTDFERDNPLIKQLAPQLGLSESQVDQIFINASKL